MSVDIYVSGVRTEHCVTLLTIVKINIGKGEHIMSYFDNNDKDYLVQEIERFLEQYTLAELMEVISACVETKENEYISGSSNQ